VPWTFHRQVEHFGCERQHVRAHLLRVLMPEQLERLWNTPNSQLLKVKRDRALLAILLACGLPRHEAVNRDFSHIQQREDHWAIVDLKGKAGHIRTVPMPRLGQVFAR
jgi:site-specific recombinase XerD